MPQRLKSDTAVKSPEQELRLTTLYSARERIEGFLFNQAETLAELQEQPQLQVFVPASDIEAAVFRADEHVGDEWSKARAQRFIGYTATQEVYIDPVEEEAPNTSLLESLRRGKEGDSEALASGRMNAHIAVIEAMIKAGHITRVEMEINDGGHWLQHGQAMLHVHANALRTKSARNHPGLMDRTEAETINGHRIEDRGREGALDDYYTFVPSLFPAEEEVPYKIATEEAGFFGDTMTAAFQLTSTDGSVGEVQSAFVAGVTEKGGPRHDIEVMRRIYAMAGYDAQDWQPLDFLQHPLFIPKEHLPNGVSDMAQIYDEFAAEIVEQEVFFGQIKDKQDYTTFAEVCRTREAGLAEVTDKVMDQLLARAGELNSPDSAIELLAELVRPLGVEHAVLDHSIDPSVFGSEAADHILQARQFSETGDVYMAHAALQAAKATAVVTMCGMSRKIIESDADIEDLMNVIDLDAYRKKKAAQVEAAEDAETPDYIRCIKVDCRKVSRKDEVVFEDRWECPHCHYAVDICTSKEIISWNRILQKVLEVDRSKIAA